MKKILLLTAIVAMFGFSGMAQRDRFFNDWYDVDERSFNMPEFPNVHGDLYNNDAAPVGSGVLILTTIGIGYAVMKQKNVKKS
ncbi:MAG: hypothetical protein MJ000_09085 [Bacteroidales bacterium]|nr:hypothetical protein [Bacteroidales bacterium]